MVFVRLGGVYPVTRRLAPLWVTLAMTAALVAVPARAFAAPILPPDFADELVVSGLLQPTALAFTPDGRMLVTVQYGHMYVILPNGSMLPTPALNLGNKICNQSERGLLGVAVDPDFTANHFVYVFYTLRQNGVECPTSGNLYPSNRVSRFVLPDSNVIAKSTETVLVDGIPSKAGNHNAGDLNFGKDGFLYVSTGDGGCDYSGGGCAGNNDASRDRHVLLGKILRVNRDGVAPASNPFTGTGSAACRLTGRSAPGTICRETFAWGLRNPFRFAFDPNAAATRFYINDVGQDTWEEVDLGIAGADYGWNVREGPCATGSSTNCGAPPAGMTNPIHSYNHSEGCGSITGGAVVPNGVWPPAYDGDLIFGDFVCGTIFRLEPSGPGYVRTTFAIGLGSSSAVHLRFGPWGPSKALYYTTYANGGQVRRIVYVPGNPRPTAAIAGSPTSGPSPLTVTFDGSGSTDPENEALTYLWTFGDGATATTTSATTTHTYARGTYTASLVVRDARGAVSDPDTMTINVANGPPSPSIASPAAGARFAVGQQITLSGSAFDAEDGFEPASRLSWRVLLHHETHTHPWFGPATGNNLTFTAPAPENLAATTNSYLEIYLTATDADGASATVQRNMFPRLVGVNLRTQPDGLRLTVNGVSVFGPATVTSWEGYVLELFAPSPQSGYRFLYWSDGGTQRHTIVTPAAPKNYKATFVKI